MSSITPSSPRRKVAMLAAAQRYRDGLDERAREYLHSRGFDDAIISKFGLGVANDPTPDHLPARGWLSIPYINASNGITAIRFRCIEPHDCKEEGHGKYWGEPGVRAGAFNTRDILAESESIALCEGEMDAITVSGSGIMPAIGLPGANSFNGPVHARCLAGFSRVVLLADGDDAGRKLADAVRRSLPVTAEAIVLSDGSDVNHTYMTGGKEALRALLSDQEDE